MRKIFTLILTVAVVLSVGVTGVTAQSTANTPTATQEEKDVKFELGDNVYVESYSFNNENATVTVTFNQHDTSLPDTVTMSNFLYKMDGGVKNYITQSYTVQGKTTITFELKKIDGKMAVLLEGDSNSKILTHDSTLFNFQNSYTTTETALFLGFGVFLGITAVTGVALKRKWEISTKVNRKL